MLSIESVNPVANTNVFNYVKSLLQALVLLVKGKNNSQLAIVNSQLKRF